MAYRVYLHIENEPVILGEIDDLPENTDVLIKVVNPKQREGKELEYLDREVTTVFWPMRRINFIELLSSVVEEEIISHVRE